MRALGGHLVSFVRSTNRAPRVGYVARTGGESWRQLDSPTTGGLVGTAPCSCQVEAVGSLVV